MNRIFFSAVICLLFTRIVFSAGKEVGSVGGIDAAKKEIIVNVKAGHNFAMGDVLEVYAENRKIVLEVTFPMQTIVKSKVRGNGKISALKKGMPVYVFSKDNPVEDITDKKEVIREDSVSVKNLEGVWKPADSTARFRIFTSGGRLQVEGWNSTDNEKFVITNVSFKGNKLYFTSTMPSTNYTTNNDCVIISNKEMKVQRSGGNNIAYTMVREK